MIVLDTSAAVDIVRLTEEGLALQALMLEDEKVISSDLLLPEIANVLRRLVRQGIISADEAQVLQEDAISLVDEFYPFEDFQTEVLSESIRLDHSAYDMYYFVLARRKAATLFTLDRKLIALCEQHGVNCVVEIDWTETGQQENTASQNAEDAEDAEKLQGLKDPQSSAKTSSKQSK